MFVQLDGCKTPVFGIVVDRSEARAHITCELTEPDMLGVVCHDAETLAFLERSQNAILDLGNGQVLLKQVQLLRRRGGEIVLDCTDALPEPGLLPDEYTGAWALPWR